KGQNRRRTEQSERVRASCRGEIQGTGRWADEKIGATQQGGRFGQTEIARIDGGCAGAAADKSCRARDVRRTAEQEYGAGDMATQQRNKFRPMLVRPILIGMRGADA